MALLDIFRKRKSKADDKLKRPSKGVLKRPKSEVAKKANIVGDGKKKKIESKEKDSELASRVILSPRITEKSTVLSERSVYVFRVATRSNKVLVKRAIKEMYGFDPLKVSIVNVPSKKRRSRGKIGIKSGYKKAVVYLKEDNKIDLA